MNVLAVIPARSGSKRLPNKNIAQMAGKPLLTWTIDAALNAGIFSRIIVSTDSQEIAKISVAANAEVPFQRPKSLSEDDSSSYDVVLHALEFFKYQKEIEFDYVALLQPTSPLRTGQHLREAFKQMTDNNAQACVSVVRSKCNPNWMYWLDKKKRNMEPILGKFNLEKYEPLMDAFSLNGAIYICNVPQFLKNESFILENTLPYIMDYNSSIDIDTANDFEKAQMLFNIKNGSN